MSERIVCSEYSLANPVNAWVSWGWHHNMWAYLIQGIPRWQTKPIDAAEHRKLGSLIELLMETKETERLIRCLREASDSAPEGLNHYVIEPAAKLLAKTQPEVAARVFRALGMRILNGNKSNCYDAALLHFEGPKTASNEPVWVSSGTPWSRKCTKRITARSALCEVSRLVAGQGPRHEPSFLERARNR